MSAGLGYNSPMEILQTLVAVIADRRLHPQDGSYTCYLQNKGIDKILKKVAEEAGEVIIAAKNTEPHRLEEELADLIFHLLVLMEEKKVKLSDIEAVLTARHQG